MTVHVFNKDCAVLNKAKDKLFGIKITQGSADRFGDKELVESLTFDAAQEEERILIGHIGDDQLPAVAAAMKDQPSIFIRCSTVGRSSYPHRIQDQLAILEMNVRIEDVTAEEWGAIISAIFKDPILPSSVIEGKMPQYFQKFFGKSSLQYLSALAILCQGYLVVHAGLAGTTADSDDKVIATALTKMGWDSANGLILVERARKDVVEPGFWDVFDVVEESNPRERLTKLRKIILTTAQKEWGRNSDPEFEPVETLIGMIGSKISNPVPVAEAYLKLKKRLGDSNVP